MYIYRWFLEHKKLVAIILILIIFITIISVSYVTGQKNGKLGGVTTQIFTVLQEPLTKIGSGIKEVSNVFKYKQLLKENEELKKEISKLNMQIVGLKLADNQLEELRSLSAMLNYVPNQADYQYITGDVVAVDGTNWFNTFTINVGTEQGIKADDAVVTGDGLVGRIYETGKGWSKVVSVIDESNDVSFRIAKNVQFLGIANGDGKGMLEGYFIDPDADVISGDTLITSGLGLYPEGIVLGKVENVKKDNDKLIKTVTIKPGVYFKNIQRVMVITKAE